MLFRLFYCRRSAQLWRFVHFGAVCGGFRGSDGVRVLLMRRSFRVSEQPGVWCRRR